MLKKITLCSIAILSTSVIFAEEMPEEIVRYMAKHQLPMPGEGVVLKDKSEMSSNHKKSTVQKEIEANIAKNGYYEHESQNAQTLLRIKFVIANQLHQFVGKMDEPTDNYIR